ncbi:DNA-binding transcriptional regulator, IclR family [Nocardiopsis flavescens]|uniref:DNA-binding transcriptional regulator, IclR family n=1 Tax=Nocardiopsis flavescens TaxID=758803 RepID=A0A1M6CS92_9ACTN|nr:IclR family transcriptional regulator [Nocardiopsis flavescens]SHI63733.1 DNA-binding transcriptional regulator, IclR family [Nocardiopsis flavescens]
MSTPPASHAPADHADDRQGANGVHRALQIIFAVAEAEGPDMGVSELARSLNLSKTVVHRVVRTLVDDGFFQMDERTRRYRLGPAAVSVGLSALARMEVPEIVRPHLEALVDHSSETATFSVRYGDKRMYLSQVLSPQEIRMAVPLGKLFPLHIGGSSRAILAGMAPEELDRHLERALPGEGNAPERARIADEAAAVRARGFTVSAGERQADAGSVAAPVFDARGQVYGSLSVCGPLNRVRDERALALGPVVVEAARAVSAGLGFRAPA